MASSSLLLCADPGDGMIVRQILEGFGTEVEAADSAEEACQFIMRRTFDSLIVDCDVPNAKWFFECLALHEPHRNAVKVAIVSPEMRTWESFSLGASFCFHKPVTLERAERSLRALQVLASRERRRAPRYSVNLQAHCVFNPTNFIDASVLDLSETGMLVHFPANAPKEKTALVRIENPETNENLVDCAGQICWSDESRRAGIRFVGMAAPERAQLRNWLHRQDFDLPLRQMLQPVPLRA